MKLSAGLPLQSIGAAPLCWRALDNKPLRKPGAKKSDAGATTQTISLPPRIAKRKPCYSCNQTSGRAVESGLKRPMSGD